MTRNKHQIQLQIQHEIRQMVAQQGFAMRHVFDPKRKHPQWSYTVGLTTPRSPAPEVFMSGLSLQARVAWLLDLGYQIKGPPPRATQQRMAHVEGIPRESLHFPAGGRQFVPGTIYRDVASNGLSACFGVVDHRYYEDFFGQAIVYHGDASFPVLQFVWTDTKNHFPWDAGYEKRFTGQQELLFDPEQYLPLKEDASAEEKKA